MDFLVEEKALDLAGLQFENSLEYNLDMFYFTALENSTNIAIMESSLDNLKEKALAAMTKILTAIKNFFDKARMYLEIKVQQHQLNKKLEELKDIMAKKKSKALTKKVNYFDVKKYKEYYTDFINRYTSELIKGLNREFKTVDEYENWRVSMLNKLADFNYKLSDEEQWKLSVTINSAIDLSEKEVNNRQKNLKMVEEEGSKSIKALERFYRKIDIENSFVNYNKQNLKIFRLQNSFIGSVCTSLSQALKKVINFMCKHIILTVGVLIAIAVAL